MFGSHTTAEKVSIETKNFQSIQVENLNKLRVSSVLEKIKENLKIDIEVDGGIDFNNSKLVIEAGANILVSGTTIFKENGGDLKKNIQLLRTG